MNSLDTGEQRALLEGTSPRYVDTGHLVFGRAGSLWAVPFDLDRLDIDGEPVPILEGVEMTNTLSTMHAAIATTGSLVYVPSGAAGAERQLVWVDRQGEVEVLPFGLSGYQGPRVSPDGCATARRGRV